MVSSKVDGNDWRMGGKRGLINHDNPICSFFPLIFFFFFSAHPKKLPDRSASSLWDVEEKVIMEQGREGWLYPKTGQFDRAARPVWAKQMVKEKMCAYLAIFFSVGAVYRILLLVSAFLWLNKLAKVAFL
jgi:hypothetical protein